MQSYTNPIKENNDLKSWLEQEAKKRICALIERYLTSGNQLGRFNKKEQKLIEAIETQVTEIRQNNDKTFHIGRLTENQGQRIQLVADTPEKIIAAIRKYNSTVQYGGIQSTIQRLFDKEFLSLTVSSGAGQTLKLSLVLDKEIESVLATEKQGSVASLRKLCVRTVIDNMPGKFSALVLQSKLGMPDAPLRRLVEAPYRCREILQGTGLPSMHNKPRDKSSEPECRIS